jgi:hypothetical protein
MAKRALPLAPCADVGLEPRLSELSCLFLETASPRGLAKPRRQGSGVFDERSLAPHTGDLPIIARPQR